MEGLRRRAAAKKNQIICLVEILRPGQLGVFSRW